MITDDTLEIWAMKGHFTNWERMLERRTALFQELNFHCRSIEPGASITTTQLLDRCHPTASHKAKDYWCNGAQYLRRQKLVDNLWRYGRPNGRTFGKPAVLWVNPDAPPESLTLEDMLK